MPTFSSPSDELPLTPVAVRRVLARLLATQFAFGLGLSAFLLLPKHLAEQGAEGWILGAIVSAMSVSVVIATPLAAYLADRVHPVRLARSGALVLAVSSFGFHLTPEAGPLMLVLRGFHGLAFSLTITATAAFAANTVAAHRLARTLGLFGATMLATQAVAPALLEPLTERFGWGALYTAAAFTALVAVALTLSLPVPRSHEKLTPGFPVTAAARSPSSRLLRPCLEASAVMGFAFGAVVAFAPALALERGASSISALFIGYTASALGIRLLGGGLGDAFGHARISLGALVVYALVTLGFIGLQPHLLAVLGGGLGLSHGLMFPSLNALVLHGTAPERRGRVQALFFGAFHFGMAVSGVLLGAFVPYVGYAGLFVVAGASVLLVGVHLGWSTRHQLVAPSQEPAAASTPRILR